MKYGPKQETVDAAATALFLGAPVAYGLARHAVTEVVKQNAPRIPVVGKALERRLAPKYYVK